jgi:hypothetical protein
MTFRTRADVASWCVLDMVLRAEQVRAVDLTQHLTVAQMEERLQGRRQHRVAFLVRKMSDKSDSILDMPLNPNMEHRRSIVSIVFQMRLQQGRREALARKVGRNLSC